MLSVCSQWQLFQCTDARSSLFPKTQSLILMFSSTPGMLPVHPASTAARHRPSARRRSKGKGGSRRAGRPAIAAATPLPAAQQFATSADRRQGRAVRGGGWGEEGQRCGIHRGQLLLPHHSRFHRCQGTRMEKKAEGEDMFCFQQSDFIHLQQSFLHVHTSCIHPHLKSVVCRINTKAISHSVWRWCRTEGKGLPELASVKVKDDREQRRTSSFTGRSSFNWKSYHTNT